MLSYKIVHAAEAKGCDHVAIVGGVAANNRLREKIRHDAERKGLSIHIPSVDLCGDNAAMIAAVGYHYLKNGVVSGLGDDVYSRIKLLTRP